MYLNDQWKNENVDGSFDYSKAQAFGEEGNHYRAYCMLFKYLVENYSREFVIELFKNKGKASNFFKDELYDKAKAYYNQIEKNN